MTDAPASTRLRLLVSVRDAAEAAAALAGGAGGADIIDVKEPARGALGRADVAVVREIIACVAGRTPVTCAWGELSELDVNCLPDCPAEVAHSKVGLAHAGTDWRHRLHQCWAKAPAPVAVAYADAARVGAPGWREVLRFALTESRCAGLLIDTAIKDGQRLFDHLDDDAALQRASMELRATGRFLALAGSLDEAGCQRAVDCGADIVAVRGLVCEQGDRQARITTTRVRQVGCLLADAAIPAWRCGG